ncbi:unnamed protein product [Arctia plantaginis]|uniref:Uncharacterized protein n=1 Tax=Arctia plantaginis TaxID=874455 RepID=A0A8S0ZZE8_ARCPL|nr:unnamed protein product [Arctia plantaginis]
MPSHFLLTGQSSLNALCSTWPNFARREFRQEGDSPASTSGHLDLRCGPPQWLQRSISSLQNFRPWPNPRHRVHWTSGDWSSARTLCRSMWTEPTPVIHAQRVGDSLRTTWATCGFPAFLRYFTCKIRGDDHRM